MSGGRLATLLPLRSTAACLAADWLPSACRCCAALQGSYGQAALDQAACDLPSATPARQASLSLGYEDAPLKPARPGSFLCACFCGQAPEASEG